MGGGTSKYGNDRNMVSIEVKPTLTSEIKVNNDNNKDVPTEVNNNLRDLAFGDSKLTWGEQQRDYDPHALGKAKTPVGQWDEQMLTQKPQPKPPPPKTRPPNAKLIDNSGNQNSKIVEHDSPSKKSSVGVTRVAEDNSNHDGDDSKMSPHNQRQNFVKQLSEDNMIANFTNECDITPDSKRPSNVPQLKLTGSNRVLNSNPVRHPNMPQQIKVSGAKPTAVQLPPRLSVGNSAMSMSASNTNTSQSSTDINHSAPPTPNTILMSRSIANTNANASYAQPIQPMQTLQHVPTASAAKPGGGPGPPNHPVPHHAHNARLSKPVPVNPTLASPQNVRRLIPAESHEVKETSDVKRNRAQLPSALSHQQPTTGDWLKKRYIVNNYILLDTLGTGSYGEVRLCKERTTDQLFAVKIISRDMLNKKKSGKSEETFLEDVKREIAIMKKLKHPNVLKLYEVLDDPKVNKLYLVLEYMKNGDLLHYLKEREDKADALNSTAVLSVDVGNKRKSSKLYTLNAPELWVIFKQTVAAVRYLHFQNIVHGDIKPQNILVGEEGLIKIADFGISKMMGGSSQKLEDAGGTPAFMAPEIVEFKGGFSGQLADIYAIAATVYMLHYGFPPFVAHTIISLYHKIVHDPIDFPDEPYMDPGLKNLLVNMLEKDPNARFNLDQVMAHPWMRHPPTSNPYVKVNTKSTSAKVVKELHLPEFHEANEAAPSVHIGEVNKEDLFKSIGFGVGEKQHHDNDCGTDNLMSESQRILEGVDNEETMKLAEDVDIMASNWGEDVFDLVDDGDLNSDSEDGDDEDLPSAKRAPAPARVEVKQSEQKSDVQRKNYEAGTSSKSSGESDHRVYFQESEFSTCHAGMGEEEVNRRAKGFQSKIGSKYKTFDVSSSESSTNDVKMVITHKVAKVLFPGQESSDEEDGEEISTFSTPNPKLYNRDDSCLGLENAEELSMNDFENMMDTLGMNLKKSGESGNEGEEGEEVDSQIIETMSLHQILDEAQPFLSNKYFNSVTGVGAVMHSEQGCRKTQEDRLYLSASMCDIIHDQETASQYNFTNDQLEQLSKLTIACVFDGHSGDECSKFLKKKFAKTLIRNPNLLNKKINIALHETCDTLDRELCELLREHGNEAGSTALISIYDGRSKTLTVANIGDSMCILSRGGKAVKMHKIFRMSVDNEEEKRRVVAAGGVVVNQRVNGVLAVSRSFGDTLFKSPDYNKSTSLVVAVPDITAEVVTPMTELAVMASDGLWDTLDPQTVVNFIKRKLRTEKIQAIPKLLVDEALLRGSVDNVSVIILIFHVEKKNITS